MNDFQVELNKYEYKDNSFNGVSLDTVAVSEYKGRLENLFQSYFKDISKHINSLSDKKEILQFIALKKDEYRAIWEWQSKVGKREHFDSPPPSVKDWMEAWKMDEETATLKRANFVCKHEIHTIQMGFIEKSLVRSLQRLVKVITFQNQVFCSV